MVFGTTEKEPTRLELQNRELAREAAAEGFVLLKNDGTLPLKDKNIALYGSGARMTVKGGTGSGAVRERYSVTIEEGLKAAGYDITTEENVTVKISVKNTGEYTGREVIQVYGTVPFGLGAEYQRLVAFEKTKELEPGEEQILEITFSLRDLTIYNEVQASYILQKGDYILRVGNASNHNESSVL